MVARRVQLTCESLLDQTQRRDETVKRIFRLTAAIAAALAAATVVAAAEQRAPWPSEYFKPAPATNVAGQFDYYTLVLSWSPTYCAGVSTVGSDGNDMQCGSNDGRRYAFVLQGLWPQYEKGFPQACRMARRPYIPQASIDRMLDIMPNPGLILQEYRLHGVCSGLPADAYLGLARRLFQGIKMPERYINPFEGQFVTPGELIGDFVSINPQLDGNGIAVACGDAGSRLKEVRICFTKEGRPRSCGDNENQRRLCSSQRVLVLPVRSTARSSPPGSSAREVKQPANKPVPRPRLIEMQNGVE